MAVPEIEKLLWKLLAVIDVPITSLLSVGFSRDGAYFRTSLTWSNAETEWFHSRFPSVTHFQTQTTMIKVPYEYSLVVIREHYTNLLRIGVQKRRCVFYLWTETISARFQWRVCWNSSYENSASVTIWTLTLVYVMCTNSVRTSHRTRSMSVR